MLDIMSSICIRHHTVMRSIGFSARKPVRENKASVLILCYILFDVSPKQHTGYHFPPLNFQQAPGLDLLSCHCRTVCFVLNSLSGGALFREHNNRKLLKFATQKYFKNKFWQDCKIRKKKDFCINLSFPEMFLITIKKAADQGATCKDSLDIDYTALFVLWKIILLALLLMFVSVLVYF